MADKSNMTSDTLARLAAEVVGITLGEQDLKATADLLNSLSADMRALEAMDVGDDEPATTYDPAADGPDEATPGGAP
jgi:hypothetical protein